MPQSVLGVAVIGLGVGEQHARTYAQMCHCTLRWVYDLDAARMRRVVAALGQGAVAANFEAILADESVDVVSIASYDDAHFAQVVAALHAGKHVFVEKPLCRSLEELCTISRAWRASANRYLASNLVLRTAPMYQWLKHTIAAGELGDVYAFDGDYLYGRLHKITEGWRRDVDDYSVMQGGGVHLVDLMLWLTGQRPSAVTAVGNRICTATTDFCYNDFIAATYRFPSGMIGRITANFGCVHRHQHVVRIFGTRGAFIYDDLGPRLHTTRDPSVSPTLLDVLPLPVSKGELIPAFIRAILHGEDRRDQAQHEFDVMSACIAADRAVATARAVDIAYV